MDDDHPPLAFTVREHGVNRCARGPPEHEPSNANHHVPAGHLDAKGLAAERPVGCQVHERAFPEQEANPVQSLRAPERGPTGQPHRSTSMASRRPAWIAGRVVHPSRKPNRMAERPQYVGDSRGTEVEPEQDPAPFAGAEMIGAFDRDTLPQIGEVIDAEHHLLGDEAAVIREQPQGQPPTRNAPPPLGSRPLERHEEPPAAAETVSNRKAGERTVGQRAWDPAQDGRQRPHDARTVKHHGLDAVRGGGRGRWHSTHGTRPAFASFA